MLVFRSIEPMYQVFNIMVSLLCLISSYFYLYRACFRFHTNHNIESDELFLDELQYNPNQAAPAPTTTDTRPACALLGSGSNINQFATL